MDNVQTLAPASKPMTAPSATTGAAGTEKSDKASAFEAIMGKAMDAEDTPKDSGQDAAGLIPFLAQADASLPVDGTMLPVVPPMSNGLVPPPSGAAPIVAAATAAPQAAVQESTELPQTAATRLVDLLRSSMNSLHKTAAPAPAAPPADPTAVTAPPAQPALAIAGAHDFIAAKLTAEHALQAEVLAAAAGSAAGGDKLILTQTAATAAVPMLNPVSAHPLPQLHPASATLPAPVATPVQQPQWGDDLGSRIVWMVKQDIKTADIRLNPAHLGPLEVKIAMQQDQVSVSFTSHHGVVRDALDAAMPRLREMLTDNGLQLANASVSHRSAADQGHSQHYAGGGHASGVGENEGSPESDGPVTTGVAAAAHYLVDYYA